MAGIFSEFVVLLLKLIKRNVKVLTRSFWSFNRLAHNEETFQNLSWLSWREKRPLYNPIDKMNPEQEYMITLTRLQLPEGSSTERLTLAISSPLS
jgi:hypothetical protein